MQSDETSAAPPQNAEQTHARMLHAAQTRRAKELLPLFAMFHVEQAIPFHEAITQVNLVHPLTPATLAIFTALCERRMQRFNKRANKKEQSC